MTIRGDLTVNWEVSPRIITIASPSTEITIQDLLDTCRYLESQPGAMDDDHLIDSAGKEFLGGTTYVGLTVTLNNAVLAFEARLGPEWVLCIIAGGNLVSVDEDRNNIDPRTPTAYTTVDRTASSSATLQEQEALQYSSFQNAVWIDINNSTTGTDYPTGTREFPVNNITDAVSIANERGFDTLEILSDMVIDSGTNIQGFTLKGRSDFGTAIYISDPVSCENISIKHATVSGILDGGTHIMDCVIGDLDYVNGHIHDSGLNGTIVLGGNKDALIAGCYTIDMDNLPVIDMAGDGQDLAMPNYSGIITVKNVDNGADVDIGIGMSAGLATLDSTISGGNIIISGIGLLSDYSSGTATVNSTGILNTDAIADATWQKDIASTTASGTTGEALNDTVNNARLIPAGL